MKSKKLLTNKQCINRLKKEYESMNPDYLRDEYFTDIDEEDTYTWRIKFNRTGKIVKLVCNRKNGIITRCS